MIEGVALIAVVFLGLYIGDVENYLRALVKRK